MVGWLSCEVAQGPKDVSDWASSAVPAPQCAAASSSRPPSAGPGSSRPEMRSQCARRDSRGSSPDPVRVVCPLFAGATAAQPGDAALTAGSSLQPLAQPSRRRGPLARGRVASRGRPDRGRVGGTNHKAERVRARTHSQQHSFALPAVPAEWVRVCAARLIRVPSAAAHPVRQCEPSVPRWPAHGPRLEVCAPSGHGDLA